MHFDSVKYYVISYCLERCGGRVGSWLLWGWQRAHVGQTAILNWRRRCPWRHQDHRWNDYVAAAVAVISPGIKFLPASAFCAAGGRSLQRAADIFYTAAGGGRCLHGFRPGTDGRRRTAGLRRWRGKLASARLAGRAGRQPRVAAVTGRNFPMACIPANDTRLLKTSLNARRLWLLHCTRGLYDAAWSVSVWASCNVWMDCSIK